MYLCKCNKFIHHYSCMIITFVSFFSAINIFLALIMSFYNWKINKNVLFLALFLILFALELTTYSINIYGGSLNYYTFLLIISPSFFLKAPLVYFFVRGIAHDRFYFRWIDLLHFIPFLIHLLANIPYLMSSYDEKLAISTYTLANIENFKYLDLNAIYPNSWNMIVRTTQLLVYTIACFLLIRKIRPKFSTLSGQLKYQFDYIVIRMRVLLFLILLIAIIQLIVNIVYFNDRILVNSFDLGALLVVMAGLAYFAIPVFVLLCPKLLYGMPHLETKHVSAYQFEEQNK